MDKVLASIMEQLSQISVRGDDVARLYAAMHMLRQLQSAVSQAASASEHERSEPHD